MSFSKADDGKFSEVKLTKQTDGKEIVLKKDSDIESLRDYVFIELKIIAQNRDSELLNIPVKLQNKLEKEVEEPLQGSTGMNVGMFKFFKNGNAFDKEKFLSNENDTKDGVSILATASFGKPCVFKRFKSIYQWPYWGYYGGTTDAIAFVPSQNVIICGFTIFGNDQPSFECKYKIYVDDVVVEEKDKFTVQDFEDKYYYRIKLDGFYEVKAGSKLEITASFSKNFDSNEYVSTYYGDTGDQWKDVENEHMGLWAVEYSNKSGSTSVGYGNFPEIMYYV